VGSLGRAGLGAAAAWALIAAAPSQGQTTCLDTATSVEIANRSEDTYLFDVADKAVDASGVHWVGITGHAIQPEGLWPGCWVGGDIEGPYGEDSVYECKPVHCPDRICPDPCLAFHTTAGLRADVAAPTIVEDLRVSGYGDGIERGEDALREPMLVMRAYLHDIKDDAIENDWGASVTVIDSLLERVNTAFASRPRSSAQIDARDRVFEVRDTLVLLHSFAYSREMEPGHGKFWKWAKDGSGPAFVVTGNTFVVTDFGGGLILPLADQVLECADNVLLWAGTTASLDAWLADPELGSDGLTAAGRLAALSDCYQLVTRPDTQSQADFLAQHFDPLVAAWKASHPAAVRTPPLPFACEDGVDNDLDGATDYPADLGCDGVFDDSEDTEGNATDDDGDGYLSTEDCDDLDPAIHPGAAELCDDAVDNDCDGKADCSDKRDCGKQPVCSDDGGGGGPGPPSEPEICDDGLDNDGDGKTDCADRKDCRRDPAC
jgi:hypothetical protein